MPKGPYFWTSRAQSLFFWFSQKSFRWNVSEKNWSIPVVPIFLIICVLLQYEIAYLCFSKIEWTIQWIQWSRVNLKMFYYPCALNTLWKHIGFLHKRSQVWIILLHPIKIFSLNSVKSYRGNSNCQNSCVRRDKYRRILVTGQKMKSASDFLNMKGHWHDGTE